MQGLMKKLIDWNDLTLTWDVFKYKYAEYMDSFEGDLTLTWDVFKFLYQHLELKFPCNLTLTWDVFKSFLL